MGTATGLERREAVHDWRERLPDALATRIGLTHLTHEAYGRTGGSDDGACPPSSDDQTGGMKDSWD